MTDRRRTYMPVLAAGVAAAVLTATATSRNLVEPRAAVNDMLLVVGETSLPLAATLSMVVLACWGVVLVTRRRVRLAVAILGALAALGVLASVVSGWWLLADQLRDDFRQLGVDVEADFSAWYWLAVLAALVSAAASVAAVGLVRSWPEMGTRYDSPTGGPDAQSRPAAFGEDDDLALWKAMDEGRDPTA